MNRFVQGCAIGIMLALLAGCATPYQKATWYHLTSGYSEEKAKEDEYLVHFGGNGYTPIDRVVDYALLRSAEVTIEKGYRYFQLVDDKYERIPNSNYTGYSTVTVFLPYASNRIKFFQDKPNIEDQKIYEAQEVIDQLQQKYNLQHKENAQPTAEYGVNAASNP